MNVTARIVGILFIIGTVAGSLSVLLTGPILNEQNYLSLAAENEMQMAAASLLVLVMAFALAMIPVVLYPIFKKYNEALAMGAVLFRGALEAFAYVAVALTWLLLINLGQDYTAGGVDAHTSQTIGTLLRGMESWSSHIVSIVFSIGALMIYWLFYVSKLIPRWLSIWGLIGAVLYLAVPLLAMFGIEGVDVLYAPLAVQEMVLALWLLIKGFSQNPTPVAKVSN